MRRITQTMMQTVDDRPERQPLDSVVVLLIGDVSLGRDWPDDIARHNVRFEANYSSGTR